MLENMKFTLKSKTKTALIISMKESNAYIHTYTNFISIRIVNSTILLVSLNTINKLRNQIYCNNYI